MSDQHGNTSKHYNIPVWQPSSPPDDCDLLPSAHFYSWERFKRGKQKRFDRDLARGQKDLVHFPVHVFSGGRFQLSISSQYTMFWS